MENRIFSIDSPKAVKAQKYGFLNAIHYMAPYKLSGKNLCPHASQGCIALCLGWESGQAAIVASDEVINSVRASRIRKAQRFMTERKLYMLDVYQSVLLAQRKADKLGLKLVIRLNGSTDIAWEGVKVIDKNLFDMFPDVQFVDYTKSYKRMVAFCAGKLPANYHLTFSRTEANETDCASILAMGGTVAAVFAGKLPASYLGATVIDGDKHDLIQLAPKGCIIGLSPKGRKAKRDSSGFVVRGEAPASFR